MWICISGEPLAKRLKVDPMSSGDRSQGKQQFCDIVSTLLYYMLTVMILYYVAIVLGYMQVYIV